MKAITLLLLMAAPTTVVAQNVPANARHVPGGKGWVCNTGYVERGNECIILGSATDAEVRQYLIRQSIAAYSGSCPCPYNVDRAGRRCGGRSAYSRPGGRSPWCYPADVPPAKIEEYRKSLSAQPI